MSPRDKGLGLDEVFNTVRALSEHHDILYEVDV